MRAIGAWSKWAVAALVVASSIACTPEDTLQRSTRAPRSSAPSVPDVEGVDLRVGYRTLVEAGFDVTWNEAFWKSPDFLRSITRYARGSGPRPPYSWIDEIRPRPGTEVERGAEVTIVNVRCPRGYRRGVCGARRDARPVVPADKTPQVVADCFSGSVRPSRMTLACADNGFRAHGLVWSRWDRHRAVGHGILRFNDCGPGCTAGQFHRRSGRIVLTGSRICEELDAYVFISGTVIFDRPFENRRSQRIYPGCPAIPPVR